MNQVYDPLAYMDRTGSAVSQIGRNVAGTLGQFFEQNAQWKQFKANQKNDIDAKQNFLNTTLALLQEKGLDPSKIPGINDVRARLTDTRITPEAFAEMTTKTLEPFKEKLLFQQGAKEYGFGSQPQPQGDPMAGGMQPQAPGDQPSQELVDTMAMLPSPGGQQGAPQAAQPATDETPTKKYQKRMVDYYSQLADNGMLKAGDATKFYDLMAKLEHDENAAALERLRAENKEKADLRKQQMQKAGESVISARTAGNAVTKDGKPVHDVNALDVMTDPTGYGIGAPPPKVGRDGSGTKPTDKPTPSWTQYKEVEAQLARLRTGKDETGAPLIFSTDPVENRSRIAEEYQAKQNQAAQQLLSHYMQTAGMSYEDAQNKAMGVIDTDVVLDQSRRSEPIITGTNPTRGDSAFEALNLAHPKTVQALIAAARAGGTASDVLRSLKKLKGLNPSRQF